MLFGESWLLLLSAFEGAQDCHVNSFIIWFCTANNYFRLTVEVTFQRKLRERSCRRGHVAFDGILIESCKRTKTPDKLFSIPHAVRVFRVSKVFCGDEVLQNVLGLAVAGCADGVVCPKGGSTLQFLHEIRLAFKLQLIAVGSTKVGLARHC